MLLLLGFFIELYMYNSSSCSLKLYLQKYGKVLILQLSVIAAFCLTFFTSHMIESVGMGDNKNFMSRYIIRVIITIINIIMISLNSATGTKIVKIS